MPACRRGDRIDEVVAAHLQEAAIVEALLADEDRLRRRLHVVVDAAPASALDFPTAKPRALSRHRRKPSGNGVPERVHFTEF
jgi:hypothetical protein